MDDIEEIGTKVECVKIGMRHSKDGHVLSLAIHPDDTPHDLLKDPLGQRYVAVLVRVDDHDEPVASKDMEDGLKAIRLAQVLCKDSEFQSWMTAQQYSNEPTEESVADALRTYLGVQSRSELKLPQNHVARKRLLDLRDRFAHHYRGMPRE